MILVGKLHMNWEKYKFLLESYTFGFPECSDHVFGHVSEIPAGYVYGILAGNLASGASKPGKLQS